MFRDRQIVTLYEAMKALQVPDFFTQAAVARCTYCSTAVYSLQHWDVCKIPNKPSVAIFCDTLVWNTSKPSPPGPWHESPGARPMVT